MVKRGFIVSQNKVSFKKSILKQLMSLYSLLFSKNKSSTEEFSLSYVVLYTIFVHIVLTASSCILVKFKWDKKPLLPLVILSTCIRMYKVSCVNAISSFIVSSTLKTNFSAIFILHQIVVLAFPIFLIFYFYSGVDSRICVAFYLLFKIKRIFRSVDLLTMKKRTYYYIKTVVILGQIWVYCILKDNLLMGI